MRLLSTHRLLLLSVLTICICFPAQSRAELECPVEILQISPNVDEVNYKQVKIRINQRRKVIRFGMRGAFSSIDWQKLRVNEDQHLLNAYVLDDGDRTPAAQLFSFKHLSGDIDWMIFFPIKTDMNHPGIVLTFLDGEYTCDRATYTHWQEMLQDAPSERKPTVTIMEGHNVVDAYKRFGL